MIADNSQFSIDVYIHIPGRGRGRGREGEGEGGERFVSESSALSARLYNNNAYVDACAHM